MSAKISPVASKIQEILLAAKRAAELTRQLLAFSRKQPQALRVVDLNPVSRRLQDPSPADRRRHRVQFHPRGRDSARYALTRCRSSRS